VRYDVAAAAVATALAFEDLALGEIADDLLNKERVSRRTLRDACAQGGNRSIWTQQLADQCRGR
jgi:hypothetical protein